MPYTARQLPNTFHVNYSPTFSVQNIAPPLLTESGLVIQTETSQDISVELTTGVIIYKSHQVGLNTFRVVGVQST